MTTHTATTEHLIRVTVDRDGDEGVEPEYLESIILDGLSRHNDKVRQHGTLDGDYQIRVLGVATSENLMGRDLAMILSDGETHSGVSGSTIREYAHPSDGEPVGPVLFEF